MRRARSALAASVVGCALAALGAVGSPAAAASPTAAQPCEQGRTRYVKDTPAALVRLGRRPLPRWAGLVPPYLIGSVAMFWVIQRVCVF